MGEANRPKRNLTLGQKILGYGVLSFAGVILFGFVVVWPVGHFINSHFTGTKTCTVSSAELLSSSSGKGTPTPSRSVHVQTSDCGLIAITDTKYPKDMNAAALVEFLNNHQGDKFEFVTEYFQFPDAIGSFGITSTTPVE